jgi:hypothetical protein
MPSRENVESVLGEYAEDHPSITLADLQSPSNYTYFPWTLPPAMVPHNATTSLMPTRPTFDISFPTLPNPTQQAPPLQRVQGGILVNHIGGLRLGMIQDTPTFLDNYEGDGYRVQSINSLMLGKDEKVFLARDTGHGLLNPADPHFTRIRDNTMLDLIVDLPPVSQITIPNKTAEDAATIVIPELDASADSTMRAAWNAIVSQISSLMKEKQPFPLTFKPENFASSLDSALSTGGGRFSLPAIASTGKGAAPVPDWPEAAPVSASNPNTLAWNKIHAVENLCNERLPVSVVRNHQAIIIKRGGCPFSQKLRNIPLFTPSPTSLQLVIIVSYGDEGDTEAPENALIRPLLDEQQYTAGGLLRQNPIPLVMVGGGDRVYEAL